jgi:hypothetical protein
MRMLPLVATICAGLCATAASAQPGDPQAPDQTLGAALMSASVGANGVLIRGSGVVTSSSPSSATYDVTFVRNIEGCVAVANSSGARFARVVSYTGAVIRVRVTDGQNSNSANPFTMLVFCTQ